MRWQPAKPRTRIKVVECGPGHWDEQDHGLDIPHGIDTIDFRITGTGHERIERAVIYDNRSKEQQTLEIDAVLVNIGFDSSLGPIKDWGLELEGSQIKVDSMMQTNRPGVFAAGDIAAFPGKLKLIATGFGEACIAVNYAKHYIDPSAHIFPGHSSNMKVEKK